MVVLGGLKFLMSEVPLYKPPGEAIDRANMAHERQSRPDCGLGFEATVLKTFQGVPSSLGIGPACLLLLLYSRYRS